MDANGGKLEKCGTCNCINFKNGAQSF